MAKIDPGKRNIQLPIFLMAHTWVICMKLLRYIQLKVEHHTTHATFLDLDITVENDIFCYKLYDKRDAFPFFIVRMPHRDSNIPSKIFYSSIYSEILRISRCTFFLEDMTPRIAELFMRMKNQGAKESFLKKQIKKCFDRFPDTFLKFGKSYNEFLTEIGY